MAKLFHTNLITSSFYSCSLHLCPTNVFHTYFYICLYLLCICLYKTKVNPIRIHTFHFGCYTSLVSFNIEWATLVAQLVKTLRAVQETWEDSLEKEMATHSSTLAWRIPWTEEPGRLQSVRSQSQAVWLIFTFLFFQYRIVSLLLFIHDTKWLYFKRVEVSCWVTLTFLRMFTIASFHKGLEWS